MDETDEPDFATFLARVRAGDAGAAEELVRQFEPAIRVIVRANLSAGLRRQFDSMDVCQSVMGTFFVRAAMGQFDLANPEELLALLARIARNKLNSQARYHARDRRDAGRTVGGDAVDAEESPSESPDRIVAGRELLDRFRSQLSIEEREIADRRANEQDWSTIAAAMGGTAEGRRKQFARALDRSAEVLGLDGGEDG